VIGDGWDGQPSVRPSNDDPSAPDRRRRVAVVTGSRAEFGLLCPVMRAVKEHPELELQVIAAGSHLVPPALTFRDVKALFEVADSVPMQRAGRTGRETDAQATGEGIARFARSFARLLPDWIVVLGDRIEAFAAAAAGSIMGTAVAHVHGGDRAEGVADESLRHAITKLAHLHLAATSTSAERIVRMGERRDAVVIVGSPALDGLDEIPPMDDTEYSALGAPGAVVLMHPIGRHAEEEELAASAAIEAARTSIGHGVLAMDPNFDAGRHGIIRAIETSGVARCPHLPRERFVGLLKRVAREGGVLIGNSSAALIESAALGLRSVDVGQRQGGREHASNVVHAESERQDAIEVAISRAMAMDLTGIPNPFGDGHAGERIAERLAAIDPHRAGLTRKRNTY